MRSPQLKSVQYRPIPAIPAPTVRQPKYHHLTESQKDDADNRAAELISDAQRMEIAKLSEVFNGMDKNGGGAVTQEQFRAYVKAHPSGWPLVDLFRAKTLGEKEREMLVKFWFRKLDVDGDGTVTLSEFIDMYLALHNIKNVESLYVEFLINLFDDNMDGKIDRSEFEKMMQVMFGSPQVPATVFAVVPEDGLDRDGLYSVLHSVAIENELFGTSPVSTTGTNGVKKQQPAKKKRSGVSNSTLAVTVLATAVITAALVVVAMSSRRVRN